MKTPSSRGRAPLRIVLTPDSTKDVTQPPAEELVAEDCVLYLSLRDSERLDGALADPPKPFERMREIARKHAEIVDVIW